MCCKFSQRDKLTNVFKIHLNTQVETEQIVDAGVDWATGQPLWSSVVQVGGIRTRNRSRIAHIAMVMSHRLPHSNTR